MRIKNAMIDKELRIAGMLMRIVPNLFFTKTGFRLIHRMEKIRQSRSENANRGGSDEWITREDGSLMRICIHSPSEQKGDIPGVLWLHGGGYAIGSPEQSLPMIRRLMAATDCVVILPEYRLSVESPYPAALQDAYLALQWMKNHADQLGIREDQLMVGGESAGGGLAAALTHCARDQGEVAIAFQLLAYPMLDDRMNCDSARDNDGPLWNSNANFCAWKLYLGSKFGADSVSPYAAPARADNFDNLPPAALYVGDLEPFRDETIEYAENLRKAAVSVDLQVFPGCFHGFDIVCPQAQVSKQAAAFMQKVFAHAVRHYFAAQPLQ